ncbi:MAG: hypothetical protein WAZ18_01065 [Alphaproteobacteria bacterium]
MNEMMTANQLRRTTFVVTALSVLPHIFCCGIPVVAGLISLGTTLGLAASLASNPLYMFVDAYHGWLLAAAFVSVGMSGILNYMAYQIDCRTAAQSSCHHGDCKPKKSQSFKVFMVSLALLAVDVAWFATEEMVLGLHHHEAHAGHSH